MLFLTSSPTNIVFLFHVQNKPRKKQKTQHMWKTIEQKPFHSQKDFSHSLGQFFSFFPLLSSHVPILTHYKEQHRSASKQRVGSIFQLKNKIWFWEKTPTDKFLARQSALHVISHISWLYPHIKKSGQMQWERGCVPRALRTCREYFLRAIEAALFLLTLYMGFPLEPQWDPVPCTLQRPFMLGSCWAAP